MECTQLLGVGLGLAVRSKGSINKMQENSWSTGYLLRDTYVGPGKIQKHENHADNMQMRQTDEMWWMIL